jgi:hypothetical protein
LDHPRKVGSNQLSDRSWSWPGDWAGYQYRIKSLGATEPNRPEYQIFIGLFNSVVG